ncbi:uncharacterized protein LOC127128829 isoform X3 [Lathyrus oleraceus]|uniref:uncharacterized protein LOC127128829 isoform X3 n=1 Tax=Pisum sativum TaxID=3888 RepID=UPI0021CEFA4C|nr:uncharacterized protein LOC127128829 isoform X3 [Pisum sativum]
MALSLGKITIILGAGFVGSVLAKEGRLPDVSGLVSGAFKVVLRQLQSTGPTPTAKNPHNDALLDQVNRLRQELQQLVPDRSIVIVNGSGTGRKYVTVVIIGVGCGCLWWKGWIPNMMFATRRSLNDACTGIGNQLGKVYESIEQAKKNISAKINGVEKIVDESAVIVEVIEDDINKIRNETEKINGDMNGVDTFIRVIESKISEIEGNQIATNKKIEGICRITDSLQNGTTPAYIQALQSGPSRLYLEQPSITPVISRTGSEPPIRSADPPSPSNTIVSDEESSNISEQRNFSSNDVNSMKTPPIENKISGSSAGGFFGISLSSVYAPLLRTRSATNSVIQQTRPTS